MTTLYDTLGVGDDADADALKRAYRKAMMKWHPDRNAGNEAAAHAAFQDVKAAYAILSDPLQRREYDTIFAAEMRRWAAADARDHAKPEHTAANEQTERAHQAHERAQRERAEQEQAQREQAAREQAERDDARAKAGARYADMVALAMRFASKGYNRDVVFGVLLGKQCDVLEAQRIADSVAAWHAPVSTSASTPGAASGLDEAAAAADSKSASEAGAGTQSEAAFEPESSRARAAASEKASPASSASTSSASGKSRSRTSRAGKTTAHDTQAADASGRAAATPADAPPDDAPAHAGHVFGTLWYHFLNGLKP